MNTDVDRGRSYWDTICDMGISPKNTVFLLMLAAVSGALLWFAPENTPPKNEKPRVAATIFPLYDIARNIAGTDVEVSLILQPSAEPHSFEPSPSTVRELSEAASVYAIGHGLDGWLGPIIASTGTDLVVVDRGINVREVVETTEDEHGTVDPHYWLSVPNAKIIAETIADDLSARFPENELSFRANYSNYTERLNALEVELRAVIPAGKRIVTFHDAWYYFAEEYGLNIAGTFEPTPGREPTPRALADLRNIVREAGVSVIFTEPLFSDDAIESFALDAAIRIAELDDIGGTAGKESYIDLMLSNAYSIAEKK